MPDQISVSEFIAETTEDYNSPTTSSFTTRLHNCRNTVTLLEEVGRGRCPPRAALRGPGPARRDASLPQLSAAASPLDCVDFRAGEEGDVWGLGEPHPPAGPPPAHPRPGDGRGTSDVQPPAPSPPPTLHPTPPAARLEVGRGLNRLWTALRRRKSSPWLEPF